MVVFVVDEEEADPDEQDHYHNLNHNDQIVELRRFADAADQNRRDDADDDYRHQVEGSGHG